MIKGFVQQISKDKNKAVITGTVGFCDLIGKVRLSYRKKSNDIDEYQRRIEPNRVKSISKFIRNSIKANYDGHFVALFPTSIILACGNEEMDLMNLSIGDNITIDSQADTLIVDGQHRYSALLDLYNKVKFSFLEDDRIIFNFLQNYTFNCSILLNFDIWEQAEVFASVNFNQKAVSKSLFYDIYGIMMPDGAFEKIPKHNEIYISHALVSYLDSSLKSPFHGFVKMLGKGSGYVSQAFFVEALLKNFAPEGIWSDAVQSLRNNNKDYMYIAYELSAYLAAIRDTFKKYWPENVGEKPISLLCKTTGIGAILLFLTNLHLKIKKELLENLKNSQLNPIDYAEIISFFLNQLRPLKPYGEELFGLNSSFAGGAGEGMQKKLYNKMKELWIASDV